VVRVILDTVLWSRIADEGSAASLADALAIRGYTVVHPPSILLEIVQSPDAESRARSVDAMASVRGVHYWTKARVA
jgi:hypothetical protein